MRPDPRDKSLRTTTDVDELLAIRDGDEEINSKRSEEIDVYTRPGSGLLPPNWNFYTYGDELKELMKHVCCCEF